MIIPVDSANLHKAALVHSIAWKASHRSFCAPDFIERHTPQRQREYLYQKMLNGSRLFMLVEEAPIGIVSVTGSLIEDLYVLPDEQNKGYGTQLLKYAIEQCTDTPTLWVLANNDDAQRLYARMGFRATGSTQSVANGIDEIEYAFG